MILTLTLFWGSSVPALSTGSAKALEETTFNAVVEEIIKRFPDPVWASYWFPTSVKQLESVLPELDVVAKKGGLELHHGVKSHYFAFPEEGDRALPPWLKWNYQVVDYLHEIYPEERVNTLEIVYLDSMLKTLDWKSGFYHVEQADSAADSGKTFGMQFGVFRSHVHIASALPELEKEGVTVGDKLLMINGKKVYPGTLNEIYQAATHREEMQFTFLSSKRDAPYTLALRKRLQPPPSVTSRMQSGILYLRIDSFDAESPQLLQEALQAQKDPRGVIIDIRGNYGGLLDSVAQCADFFLKNGQIYHLEGKNQAMLETVTADPDVLLLSQKPVVILMDVFTASGAEVFAAALNENGVAKLVGTRSNGYGLVHHIFSLDNGNVLKTVNSRLLSGKKNAIGTGLKPDFCTSALADDAKNINLATLHNGPCPVRVHPAGVDMTVAEKIIATWK